MRIRFKVKGSYKKTENFLKRSSSSRNLTPIFDRYGKQGLLALKEATPVDTGLTRDSWEYKVLKRRSGYSLVFTNTHMAGDTPVVILLQYGHGTRGGTYVEGIDFINPAIRPIFEKLSQELWKEVTRV